MMVVLICGLITSGESIKQMLLQRDDLYGADFFFPLRVYVGIQCDIYPPLTYGLYLFSGRFVMPLADGGNPRDTQMGFLVYSLYLVVVHILLYKAIHKSKAGTEREKDFFFILMLFTLPSIFLIEKQIINAGL